LKIVRSGADLAVVYSLEHVAGRLRIRIELAAHLVGRRHSRSISAITSVSDDRLALQETGANVFRWLAGRRSLLRGLYAQFLIASIHFTSSLAYSSSDTQPSFAEGFLPLGPLFTFGHVNARQVFGLASPPSTQLLYSAPFLYLCSSGGGQLVLFAEDSSYNALSISLRAGLPMKLIVLGLPSRRSSSRPH
jgi:hypothetical protein